MAWHNYQQKRSRTRGRFAFPPDACVRHEKTATDAAASSRVGNDCPVVRPSTLAFDSESTDDPIALEHARNLFVVGAVEPPFDP